MFIISSSLLCKQIGSKYQYIKKTFQKVACNNKKLSIFQSIEELKENNNHNIRPSCRWGKKIVNVKRLHNEQCTRVKKIIICFPTSSKSAQKNVRSTLKIFESCYRCYYSQQCFRTTPDIRYFWGPRFPGMFPSYNLVVTQISLE